MLTVLLSSPRVAPGLLTWPAWAALREASQVLAPSADHPLLPALAESGVRATVLDPVSDDAAALGVILSNSAAGAGSSVVWLAPPGDAPASALLSAVSGPCRVLDGTPELPGAHLLDLVAIMDRLRVSCPWDREQTHESLLRYLLEEAYEAAEAIEIGDLAALREEIGDVMFQGFFHARIAAERSPDEGGFTIDDVADTLAAKLVRRHPHVFGSVTVSSADDVNANWDEIKKAERAAKAALPGGTAEAAAPPSVLDGVPFGQPALSLAAQLQRRAERGGIAVVPVSAEDSVSAGSVSAGGAAGGPGAAYGDALLELAARARAAGVDPELELRAAARRFAERVRAQERRAASAGE